MNTSRRTTIEVMTGWVVCEIVGRTQTICASLNLCRKLFCVDTFEWPVSMVQAIKFAFERKLSHKICKLKMFFGIFSFNSLCLSRRLAERANDWCENVSGCCGHVFHSTMDRIVLWLVKCDGPVYIAIGVSPG